MKNNQMNVLMKGAMLLTIASFISKILSAFYRVPFQNMVGNIGFYVYQQVYPIYGIGTALTLSGLPILISRLIARQQDDNDKVALNIQIFKILAILGIIVFIVLNAFANAIAIAMGDVRLGSGIKSISWMFLAMPFLSTGRGYFQGKMEMHPTAYSQIIEQVIRVTIILLVAYLYTKGIFDPYTMNQYAMLSVIIAALFAIATLFYFYRREQFISLTKKKVIPYAKLIKIMILEGGAICLASSIMVLMQLVDSFTLRKNLIGFGMSTIDSQMAKGIYDRAQPMVQLGLVIGMAFASALLPTLVLNKDNPRNFQKILTSVLHISMVLTSAVAVGMFSLMPLINTVLFGNTQGSFVIGTYCLSIIFATLIIVYSSVLQSFGNFKLIMFSITFGIFVKIIMTKLMVVEFGLIGGSISTLIALILAFLVSWCMSARKLHASVFGLGYTFKLILNLMIMYIFEICSLKLINLFVNINSHRLISTSILAVLVPLGVLLYFITTIKLKLLTSEECATMPFIGKYLKNK
ncbi:putative polysaccharide biosynthesis protein [Apilactobacillus ozensis]|uniref:putative polysaccharide biosynthesis protein n=1 Tax=Apilactobacillus ozensis TaxID=866801 RepID=UPI00200AC50D|nr:polysaccharide biosynthesis protein [Apilactobacillus ozensis]MCK8607584.1 polysaccharide biosynthesis protein [Apilactobacillus ozensis]